MPFVPILLVLTLLQGPVSDPPPVAQSILANFDSWDRDSDGEISRTEIARALQDPNFHDRAAAGLVALLRWTQVCPVTPPMTKAWFEAYRPTKQRVPPKTPRAEIDRRYFELDFGLQNTYNDSLRQLRSDPHTLYSHGSPHRYEILQESSRSVPFLAVLGAIAQRNPEDIKRMILPTADGWDVTFGDGQVVSLNNLTDAQFGRGGGSMVGGRWVRIMDAAFIRRKPYSLSRIPSLGRFRGLMQPAEAMTGNRFRFLRMVGNYSKPVNQASLLRLVGEVRRELNDVFSKGGIVVAATGRARVPAGIVGGHWYAVLKFDAANDEVTIWNPWGDSWWPKSKPKVRYYERRNGVSRMPTTDFAQIFESVLLDTTYPGFRWEPIG